MKTSELIGAPLDWAVATSLGATDFWYDTINTYWMKLGGKDIALGNSSWAQAFAPSTNWALAGPIIEQEFIEIHTYSANDDGIITWRANDYMDGPTLLIAAMRCYVASKLGDEVGMPEELL